MGGYALNIDRAHHPRREGAIGSCATPAPAGSVGWADVDTGISIAICHNRMFFAPPNRPLAPLGDALYEAALAARIARLSSLR